MKYIIIYDLFKYKMVKLGSDSHFDTKYLKFYAQMRHFKDNCVWKW